MKTYAIFGGLMGAAGSLVTLGLRVGVDWPAVAVIGTAVAAGLGVLVAYVSTRATERRLLGHLLRGDPAGCGGVGASTGRGREDPVAVFGAMGQTLRHLRRVEAAFLEVEAWAEGLIRPDGDLPGDVYAKGQVPHVRWALDELSRVAGMSACGAEDLEVLGERLGAAASAQEKPAAAALALADAFGGAVERVTKDIRAATLAGQGARRESVRSLERVREAIQGLERLRSHVEINGRKIRRHGDRSIEIGAIVEVIAEVSQRTDMLALNATIESVRAGEHGRGFAVVAEAIRGLAERSADATREIGALVEVIQAETHESTRALEQEQADIAISVRRVREVETSLGQIAESSEHSARLAEGFTRLAGEQLDHAQEMARVIHRLAGTTDDLIAGSARLRDRARSLVRMLERLRGISDLGSPDGGMLPERPEMAARTGRHDRRFLPIE